MVMQSINRMIKPPASPQQLDLKELFCNPKKGAFIETFRTAAVGVAYANLDGSDRQAVLQKMKAGQKVGLIWDAGNSKTRKIIYLVRSGRINRSSMSDCFGLLNEKVAAAVVRQVTRDNIMTAARVFQITGGTRKQPKLGCVLELSTYQYKG